MSLSTNHRAAHGSGFGLQHKLFSLLLFVAFVPTAILAIAHLLEFSPLVSLVAAAMAQTVGVAVSYGFFSRVAEQANSLRDTLRRLADGDWSARAASVTNDELGTAAGMLNSVVENVLGNGPSPAGHADVQASLDKLVTELDQIAAGDLTIAASVRDDLTGPIATSLNRVLEQVRSVVGDAQLAARQVLTTSARVKNASNSISANSESHAEQTDRAASQLVEMTGSSERAVALTRECMQVAHEACESASNGLQAVSDTVEGMQRIRKQVQATSQRIKLLGESSQEIGEIVQMISEIADRTSILALNASIQASLAGDAGHGFVVVAEEIERLAENSSQSAKQISKLIRTVQLETSEVIKEMEESTSEVVEGSRLADHAGSTLAEINGVSNQLKEMIEAASGSVMEQSETASSIAGTMAELALSTRKLVERNRGSANSITRLTDRVGQLRDSVSRFRVLTTSALEPSRSAEADPWQDGSVLIGRATDAATATGTQQEEMVLKQVQDAAQSLHQGDQPGPRPIANTLDLGGMSSADSGSQLDFPASPGTPPRKPVPTVILDDSGDAPGSSQVGNQV